MKKIPLEEAILGAYRFAFVHFISIVGTIWLPTLLFFVIAAGVAVAIVPQEWLAGHFVAPADVQGFVLSRLLLILAAVPVLAFASLLFNAMIHTAVMERALGLRGGLTLIWFSLGAPVWRMLLGMLLIAVTCFVTGIATGIVFGGSALVLSALPQGDVAQGAFSAALGLIVYIAMIYIFVRLFFFLPAVIVAEKKVSPSRAWELSEGNVLRIVAVVIAVTLPVYVLAGIALSVSVIPVVVMAILHMQANDPQSVLTFMISLWPLLPVFLVIEILAAILILGTTMGAVGRAYLGVTAQN